MDKNRDASVKSVLVHEPKAFYSIIVSFLLFIFRVSLHIYTSRIAFGHKKLYQVEHENVGTQAAHKGEMLAECGLRTAYRLHKTASYRKVEESGNKITKLNIKISYQQSLNDNPGRMARRRVFQRRPAQAEK